MISSLKSNEITLVTGMGSCCMFSDMGEICGRRTHCGTRQECHDFCCDGTISRYRWEYGLSRDHRRTYRGEKDDYC